MSADALEQILRLRGVRFEWTADAPHGRKGADFGLIAEEVAAVIPEAVLFDEIGPRGVDYARLAAVLVEAVKTQQQQIAALEREIEALRKRQR